VFPAIASKVPSGNLLFTAGTPGGLRRNGPGTRWANEAVANRHNAFHPGNGAEQVERGDAAFGLPGHRHDSRLHSDLEGKRIEQKSPGDNAGGDLMADLIVRALVDTQHIHPADDASQLAI